MSPIYTKSFGGKIWKNLHSVSPDNFLDKKFKIGSLIICRQKIFEHHLVQKNWKWNANWFLAGEKKYEKVTSTFCNEESLSGEYLSFSNSFARDDVSDKTFFRPINICNTGHIKKKKINFFLPKQTVTVKVLKYCGES